MSDSPASPRYLLLQVRNPGDPAREDEHQCFAARLRAPLDRVQAYDVLREPLHADALHGFDAVLVGGSGQYSVLDELAPIRRFITFVAEIAESGLPMFASCFGYQALVVGLGGSVVADPDHAEVGSYPLQRTPEADGDPVFGALPSPFVAQLGHKDRADRLPSGVVNLASSERAPFQALRVTGRPVYATQFHPELLWSDNRARFLRYMPEYGSLFGAEAAQQQLDSHRPGPEANALLERFADHFLRPPAPMETP